MTPKIDRQYSADTRIVYSIVNCDLEIGYLLVATTEKGICTVELGDRPKELANTLAEEFKRATIIKDNRFRDEVSPFPSLFRDQAFGRYAKRFP